MEVRKDRCKAPIHGEGGDITSPSGELQDGPMTAWRVLFVYVRSPNASNAADLVWLNHPFRFSGLTS